MRTISSIKIMLVDDHAIVREGYKALLEQQPNMKVVVEAGTGEEAYQLFKEYQPNLVIMDLSLPNMSGIETISRIRKYDPRAKILVFTMHQNSTMAAKAIQAGARGYVTKSSLPSVLIEAIYDVHNGIAALSQDIEKAIALESFKEKRTAIKDLSVREFEILRLIVSAKSASEISKILKISKKTVSNYHYLIKNKLGVVNDVELTHLAISLDVINSKDIVNSNKFM